MSIRSTEAGFTFVELLIALFVVSLLVSYLWVSYAYARSNAEGATVVAELHKAMVYLEEYKQNREEYPRSVGEFRRGSPFRLHPDMKWRVYNARALGATQTTSVRMVVTYGDDGASWLADYPMNGTRVFQR